MKNFRLIQFKDMADKYGHLTPIEGGMDIGFDIKRVYYITRVEEGVRRGFHSHNELEQILVCISGSVKILVKNPYEEKIITLNNPAEGIYIGPMIWREMYDFSEHAALLVLASEHYLEKDYIRNYDQYETMARQYFIDDYTEERKK